MSTIGKYIVVFKESASVDDIKRYMDRVNAEGGSVTNVYDTVLKGFAATIPDSFLQNLQGDDLIDYIEPDGVVTTQ
jgi:predicted enzyme related to lactoylglutathione lyase